MKKNTLLLIASAAVFTAFAGQPVDNRKEPASHFKMRSNIKQDEYLANTIVFKVKPEYRSNCTQRAINNLLSFNLYLTSINATAVEKMFPAETGAPVGRSILGQQYVDLSLIYTLTYAGKTELSKAINSLYTLGYVEYAEPYYIPKPFYNPNDPKAVDQYHLNKINAFNAWNITKGDSNIVIGIVDTGTDPLHPDLKDNIMYNANDPINGVDDDNDGYIDNYAGWDVGMNDNDPTWQGNAHGVHVSGCSSARTDNNVGIAGSGFKCKFLPVKIANAGGSLIAGYQGIKYAADHGCAIINCSWGGSDGSSLGNDVINYAIFNKNALVIAAAGNDGNTELFFPAAHQNALSVAATTSTDEKSDFSNYGYTVDVCAPGTDILATYTNNGYVYSSGTSMASPIAAGAAALIKTKYPNYHALQIGQRLKETADNIYAVGANNDYANGLGNGRINMLRALTDSIKSLSMLNRKITDNDGAYLPGDTIAISGDFVNYFGKSSLTANAVLSTIKNGSYVDILTNTFTIGALNELEVKSSILAPFKVKINANTPTNTQVDFKVTITDGAYTSAVYFSIIINPDYINIIINDVRTTVTSKGRIGFNKDGQLEGLGFNYKGNQLLYESSFMVSDAAERVSDMFRGDSKLGGDEDNISKSRATRLETKPVSDFDVMCAFNDSAAPTPIGISTRHKAFAWSSAGNRKFVIHKYVLINNSAKDASGVYAGIISDWDIMDPAKNKGATDNALKLGYTYSTDSNALYAGVKLLTPTPFVTYAIDNIAGGGGGVDIVAGSPEFSTAEKNTVLSTNRLTAGDGTPAGNDIIQSVSTGPFTIKAGDSIVVAFAMLAGDNLADLKNSADNAQTKYNGTVGIKDLISTNNSDSQLQCYPNPAGKTTAITFNLPIATAVDLKIYNAVGQLITTVSQQLLQAGAYTYEVELSHFSNGLYYCQLKTGNTISTKKLLVTGK